MNGFAQILLALFIGIAASCAFNSLLITLKVSPNMAPYQIGVNVMQMKANEAG